MVRCLSLVNSIYNGEKSVGSDNLFHNKKFRKAKELARHKARKSPYETIQIICEGQTEFLYFNSLVKFFRLNTANVIVLTGKGSAPISIVDHGIEIARNTPNIDRIACVFDYDNHESYERAISKLKNHKPKRCNKSTPTYKIITSNPCFEIWLLLHFLYTTKAYHSTGNKSAAEKLMGDLRNEFPSYAKGIAHWFDELKDKLDIAIKNAKKLSNHNNQTNSVNPATNIHELVEHLRALKT